MTPDEIKDQDSLRAWLEGQTREVAVTIAHRAAMRVAPIYWLYAYPRSQRHDLSALVVTRALVTAAVNGIHNNEAIMRASEVASSAAFNVEVAHVNLQANAVKIAAAQAAHAGFNISFATDAVVTATRAGGKSQGRKSQIREAEAIRFAMENSVRFDADPPERLKTNGAAFSHELWPRDDNQFLTTWKKVRGAWAATGDPGWQFWIDWYEAALAGEPLLGHWDRHWALLTDIALIASEDWDAGPDRVNPLVAHKYEIHGLRAEADRLKRELQAAEAAAATAAHRSHNQPPELLETPSVQQYRIVLKALDDAETELAKPEPSSSKLRAVANVLLDWTKSVAVYCAELGDVALKEMAKGIGKAAAGGAAVLLAAQSEQVRQFANALKELATRLP